MKKCASCGYENDDSFKFCMNCGTPIPEVAPVVAPVVEEPVSQIQQPIQQQVQQVQQPIQQYQQPIQQPIQQPVQQYQQPVTQMTEDAPSNKTNGLCIAGFVLAMLSFITAGITSLFGLVLSIIGLISSSKKKQKGKGMAIAGIIVSALFIVALAVVFIAVASTDFDDFEYSYHYDNKDRDDEDDEDDDDDEDDFDIKSLIIDEGSWIETNSESYLVFENKKEFKYYKDYDVLDDYYYEGTYKIYVGEDAVDYVVNDLSEYYVEEDELEDLFDRNDKYSEENFILIILNNDHCYIEGEDTPVDISSSPYFGFFIEDDGHYVLDIANMNSANYYWFIPESDYN